MMRISKYHALKERWKLLDKQIFWVIFWRNFFSLAFCKKWSIHTVTAWMLLAQITSCVRYNFRCKYWFITVYCWYLIPRLIHMISTFEACNFQWNCNAISSHNIFHMQRLVLWECHFQYETTIKAAAECNCCRLVHSPDNCDLHGDGAREWKRQ